MSGRWFRNVGVVFASALVISGCSEATESSGPASSAAASSAPVTSAAVTSSDAPLVTASAAPDESTTPPTSAASPSTTGGAGEQPAVEGFRSPTGNIHCELSADGARCSHHGETPWKVGGAVPVWAGGVSFGFTEVGCLEGGFVGFGVAASGRPQSTCGDSLYTAPDTTLQYGERRTMGDVSCLSQRFGMTCLNAEGNGFRMATNEIVMLYDRPAGWAAEGSSTADERLAFDAVSTLDEGTKFGNESETVACYITSFEQASTPVAYVECTSATAGVDWSPGGASCAGADFHGFYLDDDERPGSYRIATFGCTTDMSPLVDPSVAALLIADGDAVVMGGITCVSTGPGIACHNPDGNGVLTAVDEVSFFYGRNP